jgi:molybdopterin molybdotransferase
VALEPFTVLELEEAVERILAAIAPLPVEKIPLSEAAGRILGQPLASAIDLPHFDNSAMDGYAVSAADLATASSATPVSLRLIGRVAAGEIFSGKVLPGMCVRLFTGSPVPRGADAVVMQEDALIDAADRQRILFREPVKPWENVRFRGEDVKSGTVMAEAGQRISVGTLSLFAATGVTEVAVGRRPKVGLLATGSELREGGKPLAPGEIYESNRIGLSALVSRCGGMARPEPSIADDLEATVAALQKLWSKSDAVITSGGVSVGEFDFVKAAFEKLGGKLDFWRVAIRPGKPFVFGRLGKKCLFGLPGNPVSALVTFWLLVRPALLRMQGMKSVAPPIRHGILAEPLANRGDRRHFMRVQLDENGIARLTGAQASHILSSLAVANGLVDVPAGTTLPAASRANVLVWD